MEVRYELSPPLDLRREEGAGIWRFASVLPEFGERPTLGEGGTFLRRARRLGRLLGLKNLYVKDETRNPTGAFTDRGAAVAIAAALHYGFREVISVTGGDLAASLAAYSASQGLTFRAYFEEQPNVGKMYQILFFGGEVVVGRELRLEPAAYAVLPEEPLLLEGYKTISLELFETLGERAGAVVVPVGHGALLYSVWKGFRELSEAGLIDSTPRLYGAQAASCAPIAEALEQGLGEPVSLAKNPTIATEIAEARPARGREALAAIRESKGSAVAVGDDEIAEGLRLLAKHEGLLVETASAAAVAALKHLVESGEIDRSDVVVLVATGAGLKDPKTLVRILEGERPRVGRTGLEILEALSEREMHGYALWRELVERGREISRPAVYYHLYRLESLGLIRKLSYSSRKAYSVTERGRRLLEELKNSRRR